MFQYTAARRRLEVPGRKPELHSEFQHTAARRRLGHRAFAAVAVWRVSTHSRPKAAGFVNSFSRARVPRFNTQPPEDGCSALQRNNQICSCFNTQPPEDGCYIRANGHITSLVSTHSRPKTAAIVQIATKLVAEFQHTAARRRLERPCLPTV